ncbi:MAG: hypothetical protein QOD00_1273 [Blastocatellia bacterium]|jgi:hypothetical protein|nr:hypothetical protein [Blastocatellia bacterium]
MKSNQDLNAIFDNVTASIRDEQVDQRVIESAGTRAWSKINSENAGAFMTENTPTHAAAERIENCADFQSLIPGYLKGELSEARTLLFKDHTHECIPCRKALKAARSGAPAQVNFKTSKPGFMQRYSMQPVYLRWGIAAMLVVGFGLLVIPLMQRFTPFGSALNATVQAAEGPVFKVDDTRSSPLSAGQAIGKGESIRTAKDAHAVLKLTDGSSIEMKDRSEFYLTQNGKDATIHLDRGSIIVEAAKQKGGHLYVDTGDSLVSVTGTTFSVNTGTKGSRVSVIEGEVHLDHAGQERVIHPGEQATTHPSIQQIPVKDEISWSRDAARYAKSLPELNTLRRDLNNVARPGVRTSTGLLDLMPENTVLYAALPNLSETLSESHRIMQERIKQNPALRDWIENERAGRKGPGLDQTLDRVREFGERLGDEIAVGASIDAAGKPVGPLVLAQLKDAASFRSFLEGQLKSLSTESNHGPAVRIIDDPLTVSNNDAAQSNDKNERTRPEIFVWIHDNLFAASPKLEELQSLAKNLQSPGANTFASTPFYARISEIYHEGAGLIVAADLQKIIEQTKSQRIKNAEDQKREGALQQLGLTNLKYFILDQKEVSGKTHSRAVLSFNESQHGIVSWLAAPGPMGSLEYISPDANVVAGFVVKNPVALVDDLLGVIETTSPGLQDQLKKLETEHGLDVRKDFAAPLGGEFAFAIDGPILPTPSWKMVFEVNDPAHLQATLEKVVGEVNQQATKEGRSNMLQWERADIGGRTFYTLKTVGLPLEVNYTFINGYMVVAPTRALVDRALRYKDSGYTLLRSPRFTAGLPADGNANFSALFYHNLAPVLEPIAQHMGDAGKNLPEEQQQALKAMASEMAPTLAYAYAEGDHITFAANTEGGPFGLSPASLLGMPNAFEIQHILQKGMHEK